jgi:hypothetical protein
MTELARAERARLAELEAVVARALATFIEVGLALDEIRDRRLYRATRGTFAAYCAERWGFSRLRGYRLIRAAELAAASPTGDIRTERQARGLLKPGRPDPSRRILALAFGLDPDGPLPASPEAVWQHGGERPNRGGEMLQWEAVGDWLMGLARRETDADTDFVVSITGEAARVTMERVAVLEAE